MILTNRRHSRADGLARTPSRRRRLGKRDQHASPFAAILTDLIGRIPGAYAAALVDGGGETVDYCGDGDPFDVKIAAAHWRIVLGDVIASVAGAPVDSIVIRGEKKSFIVRALPDAYALVVLLARRAGFTASSRAIGTCARALAREAGWDAPGGSTTPTEWYPVSVECDPRRRPVRIRGTDGSDDSVDSVEVLGSVVGLQPREAGFRVRLSSGAEVTLVREAGGVWYSDDPLSRSTRS